MRLSTERAKEVRQSFSAQGLMRLVDASIAELDYGRCVIALPFSEKVTQQKGYFHGGVLGAIADSAGGYAAMTVLGEGTEVVTVEYKINFLRPAVGQAILAEGSVIRTGRRMIVTRVDVQYDTDGVLKHCAALQQTIAAIDQS